MLEIEMETEENIEFAVPFTRNALGTTDYEKLENQPSINGVRLIGDKTIEELGIEIRTKTSELENDSGFLEHKGTFYDWFEFDEYEFKEGEIFLFNLSGAFASREGICIGQYSGFKIGDTYVYKYIRCFNTNIQQSLTVDILNRKINANQMNILDTNDYFVANGLDDILQEIGGKFKNGFEGKILSILGDSISTFEGYVPTSDGYNLEHRTTYPSSNLLTDVADTWWHRLITNLNMKLGVNDSWSGTRVSNSSTTDTGSVGPKTHMASMTRISNLGANGNPDLILFFGGTNDIRGNVTLGNFDPTATHTTVDLTSETYSDFATAYKTTIQRLMYMYPKAKIVAILPMVATRDYTIGSLDKYIEIIKNICDYFGVYCIDIRRCGINYFNASDYLPDGLHPNAKGMELMERYIKQQLLSAYSFEEGETTTYNVTNNLNNVVSDKINVKAVRSGETYKATIISNTHHYIDTVNVTMDGNDITATAYSNGVITIQEVTGDIVITATAIGRATTNSHAKTIPLTATADTNLAEELGLVNEYYYNKKWRTSLTDGTLVYSLTIPVMEGDRIYSLSFEASDKNGVSSIGRTDNGARITFFDNETAVSAKTPAETYTEFSEYGYITVPAGVNAVNISTWIPDNQVIKLLTL